MELEIKEEKENPFLGRKELMMELNHGKASTPSKKELITELASKYSVPEEHVVIDYILTKKGIGTSVAKVKIYKEKPKVKEVKKKEIKNETQTAEAK